MKLFLGVLLVSLFLVNVSAQAAPTVSITAPSAGETLTGGETYRITWSDPGTSFAAVYYKTGDKWSTLYSCNKNAHRYDWVVPEIDSDAQIRVEAWVSCGDDSPYATGLSSGFEIESGLPDPCSCDSCQSCSNLLEGSCETVTLSRDITSSSGQCINFEADDKTFDCDDHEIKGGASSQEFYYGIFAKGDGLTIENCEISEFEAGIDLHYVTDSVVKDCTLNDNYGSGMFIAQSNGVELKDNVIEGSAQGIYLANSSDMDFDGNRVCGSTEGDIISSPWGTEEGNTRNGNTCDLIYNWNGDNDVTWCDEVCNAGDSTSVGNGFALGGALNGEYGSVELTDDVSIDGLSFDGSHITLNCNNHRISGSGSGIGVLMENRVNNELIDCIIEDFATGVELRGTSHSRITSNMIRRDDYGLIIREGALPSIGNEIRENMMSQSSLYGAYMDGEAFDNVFRDNTLLGEHYSLLTTANCDNDIDTSNEGQANFPIGYFHDQSGLDISGGSYSALILCNVDNSEFSGVEAGAGGSDALVVRDCEGTSLDYPQVQFSYNGIIIEDSSGITINNPQVQNTEIDCISVSQSDEVDITDGSLRGCDRGVALSFSSDSSVEDISITDSELFGIYLYTTTGTVVNNVLVDGGVADGKGIVLLEGSDGNIISDSTVIDTMMGVQIDETSGGNRLERNIICDNSADIYDYGNGNTGSTNNCSVSTGWGDEAYGKGCEFCCANVRYDINKDGVDDACDCYDAYQSHTEDGVDCGGRCGECVECTWCGTDLDPIRVKGSPNSGMIDIVFLPHRDFKNNLTIFENEAYMYVREHYLRLDEKSYLPLPDGWEDSFNFYIYRDGYGYSGDCAGKLPGETDYQIWLGTCTAACVASLGLACGCYAHEPDHFYGDAGWADTAGILTMGAAGCANTLGPQSHFISERAYPVVIHESGHAVFGLVDEYCGDTHYEHNDPHPNVWGSLSGCQSYAASHGWTLGTCTQIASGSCSKGYYRYDPDVPINSYMTVWNSGWNYMFWEAASERLAYVFERYPGGGSRGVLVYVNSSADGMKKVGTTVVEGHPDLGMQVAVYWGEVVSAGKERIREFGLWDNRKPLAGTGSEAETLDSIVFPINFPFKDNPRWLNIYNASSGELVISMDLAYELYGWCDAHNWEGDDCASLDLDDNGVPDAQETGDWNPEERIVEASFSDRDDLEVEVELEESAPPVEESEAVVVEQDESPEPIGGSEGMGLEIIIALIVIVVALIAGALVLRKKL